VQRLANGRQRRVSWPLESQPAGIERT
jgi:hypothetical protein